MYVCMCVYVYVYVCVYVCMYVYIYIYICIRQPRAPRLPVGISFATLYPQSDVDWVLFFDCFHRLGREVSVSQHRLKGLQSGRGLPIWRYPYTLLSLEIAIVKYGKLVQCLNVLKMSVPLKMPSIVHKCTLGPAA